MKVKVSVGEVHGTKVRGASVKSPKICFSQLSVVVVSEEKHNITEFFHDTTVLYD